MRTNHLKILLLLLLAQPLIVFAATHGDEAHKEAAPHEADAHATKTKEDHAKTEPAAEHAPKNTAASESHDAKPKAEDAAPKAEIPAASESKSPKFLPSDVRVLIDVSGSMKQTDPQNLRKPALDLIARLLPDKSRAGIWTFGNSVNMLMPFKPVDPAWRKQAAPKANEINSIAMFTNIGKALDEVSFDKKSPSQDYKTHVILLTDGVVDIGPDAVVNNKERQRILSDILPSMKKAGYTIHTIALSADADVDLMKKLSVATDGVFTTAISAEQLMPVFLKIFDQAVPAERVPLENNGFLVDASIKEFTALIFRKPGEDRSIIVSPEGKEYSATNPTDGINWYRTDKYDLITADSPKAGQWKIKTEIAPQSRVTVVSNLQLMVDPLKNNLHSNDSLSVNYSFQENGKTVTNKDFLGLIETNAIVAKEHAEENFETNFTVSTPPSDGIFHQTLTNFADVGEYEVHIYVDGKTFKREFKHTLSVRDGYMVLNKSNAKNEHDKSTYTYKITTDEKLVDLKKTHVTAIIKNSHDSNLDKELNLIEEKRWEFSFTPVQEGDYTIDIHAQGELLDGTAFDETLHADKFTIEPAHVEKHEEKHEEKHDAHDAKEEHKKEEVKAEEPKEEEKPKEDSSNIILYSAIGIGNLLLLALGYFAYKKIMGGSEKSELDEFEQTLKAANKKDAKATPTKAEDAVPAKKPVEKTEIDLSDEDPAHIPMNEDSNIDKLFPLDSMEDPNGKDENNL